jgi:hypothetical protein
MKKKSPKNKKKLIVNPEKKFQAQKRAQIIEILKEIINLQDRELNDYLI